MRKKRRMSPVRGISKDIEQQRIKKCIIPNEGQYAEVSRRLHFLLMRARKRRHLTEKVRIKNIPVCELEKCPFLIAFILA